MLRSVLAIVVASLALAGCGSQANPEQPKPAQPSAQGNELSATDLATVAGAYRTIRDRCEGLADTAAANGAAAALVRVLRANDPELIADFNDAPGPLNLRATLRDAAGQLRRCGATGAAARLTRAAG
jgi:hypothetical protein